MQDVGLIEVGQREQVVGSLDLWWVAIENLHLVAVDRLLGRAIVESQPVAVLCRLQDLRWGQPVSHNSCSILVALEKLQLV